MSGPSGARLATRSAPIFACRLCVRLVGWRVLHGAAAGSHASPNCLHSSCLGQLRATATPTDRAPRCAFVCCWAAVESPCQTAATQARAGEALPHAKRSPQPSHFTPRLLFRLLRSLPAGWRQRRGPQPRGWPRQPPAERWRHVHHDWWRQGRRPRPGGWAWEQSEGVLLGLLSAGWHPPLASRGLAGFVHLPWGFTAG